MITLRGPGGADVLHQLGYRRTADFYVHSGSPFPLEFPPGPLMVGDDLIDRWDTIRRADQVLYVLSATDSCRDRLAAFMFWNDFSALEQALAVCHARRPKIDFALIRDWCRRAGHIEKFNLFLGRAGG